MTGKYDYRGKSFATEAAAKAARTRHLKSIRNTPVPPYVGGLIKLRTAKLSVGTSGSASAVIASRPEPAGPTLPAVPPYVGGLIKLRTAKLSVGTSGSASAVIASRPEPAEPTPPAGVEHPRKSEALKLASVLLDCADLLASSGTLMLRWFNAMMGL